MLSLWFLLPGFDPRSGSIRFSKNKLTERSLKCACHSVDWMETECWLKGDWNPPFPSSFSRHSATIQSPFSRLKGDISSCDDNIKAGVSVCSSIFKYAVGTRLNNAHTKKSRSWRTTSLYWVTQKSTHVPKQIC